VGWGLGDASAADMTVKNFKAFARRMYKSYMGDLADTNVFDQQLYDRLVMMQDKLVASNKLTPGKFLRGVLDLPTQVASGFRKAPNDPNAKRPIIITVEGHMSDMWIGPCAAIGAQMEAEGLAWHQPIAYDRFSLPFKNQTGVDEVLRFLNQPATDIGKPFPDDLDWYMLGFSQGSIITNKVWMQHLKFAAPGSRLAARREHLKRAIAFGDPWREKNADAGWWPDPPKPNTQGISDERMVDTPSWWKSANRHGDLYTENTDDEAGLYKTSIYKIAAENSWSGGPAGMLMRLMDLLTPTDDIIPVFQAIIGGVLFLGNMNPHGGYNLDAPTDYIRQGLLGR
jgi:hypothetical protein